MSKNAASLTALIAVGLLAAAAARAQQTPPPNPLDNVPEKMPFDVPYGAPISLDRAQAAIAATVAEAKKRDWKMNVAVVDSGGNLVAFARMDGAQLASVQISEHKARAANQFRRETKVFESGIQLNSLNYLITLDGVIASRGGIPLVEGGKVVCAIGCSGGTGSQDEVVCRSGAEVIKWPSGGGYRDYFGSSGSGGSARRYAIIAARSSRVSRLVVFRTTSAMASSAESNSGVMPVSRKSFNWASFHLPSRVGVRFGMLLLPIFPPASQRPRFSPPRKLRGV